MSGQSEQMGGQRGVIMASLLVLQGPVVLGPSIRLLASDGPGNTVQRTRALLHPIALPAFPLWHQRGLPLAPPPPCRTGTLGLLVELSPSLRLALLRSREFVTLFPRRGSLHSFICLLRFYYDFSPRLFFGCC